MSPTCVIAVMVRVPVAGQVKTRLIPALGAEGACRLYRAMVDDILVQAQATGVLIHLFYTGGRETQLPLSWRQGVDQRSVQRGADLGARMAHVFATCFAEFEQVVLIGSDIPDMNAQIVLQAIESLKTHDVVINPTKDGGYCLLGLRRGVEFGAIFEDMPWSTDQVFAMTRQRLEGLGLGVGLLPILGDIDTPADLLAYQKNPNPAASHVNRLSPHP